MPNPIMKVFAFILFTLAIFFVVYQSYQKQDDLAYQVAYQAVNDFVDNVRTKGYISPKMIEDFEAELEIGSYVYDIEYVHEKKVYTPVYEDPTNVATWTGEYVIDYDEYYKNQIFPHLFDESNSLPKKERMYYLSKGDFFSVRVENKNMTKATMLLDFLTGGNSADYKEILIPAGGLVLNEDY